MEIRIRKRSDCSDADPIDITEYWRRAARREIEMGREMATAGCAPRMSRLGAADSLSPILPRPGNAILEVRNHPLAMGSYFPR